MATPRSRPLHPIMPLLRCGLLLVLVLLAQRAFGQFAPPAAEIELDFPELNGRTSIKRPARLPPPTPRDQIRRHVDEAGHVIWIDYPRYLNGGYEGIIKCLRERTRQLTPDDSVQVEGLVLLKCEIGPDGRIYNARIFQSFRPYWDTIALRVVEALGDFQPGVDYYGNRITVTMIVPVEFKLP